MFLTMGSLGDWISLTGERISTTSELGVAHISPPEGDDCPLNGGACGPRPPGLRPLPCRAFGTLGRHPATADQSRKAAGYRGKKSL